MFDENSFSIEAFSTDAWLFDIQTETGIQYPGSAGRSYLDRVKKTKRFDEDFFVVAIM